MQDYPQDGGLGMSQVFNGQKMLSEFQSPPAVWVDGKIFFINELLQEDSENYFIPEHFFYGPDQPSQSDSSLGSSQKKLLYALGREVQWTEVRFLMNPL